jgi:hypothetical protein
MAQSWLDSLESQKLEADMARMLATLDRLATSGAADGNPELKEMLKNEMNAQARANPGVVKKVAQRVSDEGGDPASVLGNYLPASEVSGMARSGKLAVAPPTAEAKAAADKAKADREAKSKEREEKLAVAKAAEAKAAEDKAAEPDKEAEKEEEKEDGKLASASTTKKGAKVASAAGVPEDKAELTAKAAANPEKAGKEAAEAETKKAGDKAKKEADKAKKETEEKAKKKADKEKKKAEKDAKKAVGGLFK